MINLKTKKILIPFDFSETAENAVKHAALIAALTKGELIILNVQKKNELLNMLLPILSIKIYQRIKFRVIKFFLSQFYKSNMIQSIGFLTDISKLFV